MVASPFPKGLGSGAQAVGRHMTINEHLIQTHLCFNSWFHEDGGQMRTCCSWHPVLGHMVWDAGLPSPCEYLTASCCSASLTVFLMSLLIAKGFNRLIRIPKESNNNYFLIIKYSRFSICILFCVCVGHVFKCLQTEALAWPHPGWLPDSTLCCAGPACAKGNRWVLLLQLDLQMPLGLRALKSQRHKNLSAFLQRVCFPALCGGSS